jgi:hypothetical protein
MKKIHLFIPRPCHENWDAMAPTEKGKFCASCQKTVIDFTRMSDRQLAEFFKKPPSSVCGRVYNDQLDRDIAIPKKRIPWIRYFFQFTWPAFALFLKSCGVKDNSQGKIKVESKTFHSPKLPIATVGIMMPEITPVDTTKLLEEKIVKQGEIMGDIAIQKMDSAKIEIDTLVTGIDTVSKPMDSVTVVAYQTKVGVVVMGGISSVCMSESNQIVKDTVKDEESVPEINFKVYPNPVSAGSLLNISFEYANDFPKQIQLFSSSGQLVLLEQNKMRNISSNTIQIPSNITAGTYFLQFITKNKQSKTTKVIVTK